MPPVESDWRAFAEAHDLHIVARPSRIARPSDRVRTEDGRLEHRDVELVTEHYSRGQIAGRRAPVSPATALGPAGVRRTSGRHALRSAPSGPAVMTFDDRVRALAPLGFNERQTRFLVTVALHSGFCLRRHYMTFASLKYGAGVRDFLDRLVVRKLATRFDFRRDRGHVYHLQALRNL